MDMIYPSAPLREPAATTEDLLHPHTGHASLDSWVAHAFTILMKSLDGIIVDSFRTEIFMRLTAHKPLNRFFDVYI